MIEIKDIYWLAGLLEGEGSFGLRSGLPSKGSQPILQLGMTDRDIVDRVAVLLGITSSIYVQDGYRGGRKPLYSFLLCGPRAVAWMMTLYPLLGERRRMKIREVLTAWRASPAHGKWARRKGYKRGEKRAD